MEFTLLRLPAFHAYHSLYRLIYFYLVKVDGNENLVICENTDVTSTIVRYIINMRHNRDIILKFCAQIVETKVNL